MAHKWYRAFLTIAGIGFGIEATCITMGYVPYVRKRTVKVVNPRTGKFVRIQK